VASPAEPVSVELEPAWLAEDSWPLEDSLSLPDEPLPDDS
jgi:hypothetical protein